MTYFAVHYTYADGDPDIARVRPDHRVFLGKLKEEGKLVASGPYVDGHGSALILLQLDDTATVDDALKLMDHDPYTVEGVLDGREIREWSPVLKVF
ncbi:YciI family protein [Corynebacterium uterequi]|uniref:YCII-related domain-containing protein n=1 Tax=Corynebacterium uterequi TaxID=1072256 RepID=A0A0G3HDC1_9CORY|nr:YciI family protein [Corynebacterium uterequi]AKK11309.1 hypothetical protein CUTER_06600 [Corynebacterium uterequi]